MIQPASAWITQVKKGDVLRAPSGALRVVRAVNDTRGRRRHSKHRRNPLCQIRFYFAIMHCSWTHAGYTLYSGGEILSMGWEPTGLTQGLDTALDRALERDFGKSGDDRTLTCCDVVGLP